MMERGVVDRDLHLGAGKLPLARLRAEVPRREGLSGAVLAANPLREALATRNEVEVFVDRVDERIEPCRELVEAHVGHEAAAERVHDRQRLRELNHQRASVGRYRYIVS